MSQFVWLCNNGSHVSCFRSRSTQSPSASSTAQKGGPRCRRNRVRILKSRFRLISRVSRDSLIKNRNFDPESRTLRKLNPVNDQILQDSVEKNVDGLAEEIIEADKERRAHDLVRIAHFCTPALVTKPTLRTFITSRRNA